MTDPTDRPPPFTAQWQQPQPVYAPAPIPQNIIIHNSASAYAGQRYARPRTNHGLHLVLTLLTCGMWAPVWFFVWMANGFH